jgi:ribosomal protein S18 acetylase RimI-like enzyme
MGDILIRPYKEQDWNRIEEIHDEARKIELNLAGLDDAFIPLVEAAESEGLFDYDVCVALANDHVVGFAAYSEDELAWLYVDPSCMRQGIGKSLIKYAIQHIAHRPIELEVLVGNEPAVRLYESLGFKLIKTISGVMPGNEFFAVNVHCMELN